LRSAGITPQYRESEPYGYAVPSGAIGEPFDVLVPAAHLDNARAILRSIDDVNLGDDAAGRSYRLFLFVLSASAMLSGFIVWLFFLIDG
jgi:hypothetical protein